MGAILLVLFLTVCVIESISRYLSALIRREFLVQTVSGAKRKRHLTLLGTGILLVFFVCLAAQTPPDFSHTSPETLKSMIGGLLQADWAFFFSTKKTASFTCCLRLSVFPLQELESARFWPFPLRFSAPAGSLLPQYARFSACW